MSPEYASRTRSDTGNAFDSIFPASQECSYVLRMALLNSVEYSRALYRGDADTSVFLASACGGDRSAEPDVAGIVLSPTLLLPLDIRTPKCRNPLALTVPATFHLRVWVGLIVDEHDPRTDRDRHRISFGHYGGSVSLTEGPI
jgi:hypothetical protein